MNGHIYHYDEVVIGNCLSSVLYAHKAGSYFIYNVTNGVFSLDTIDNEITSQDLVFSPGSSEKKVITEILYDITLKGLSSVSGKIQSIRVEEEKLKIITENSKVIQIKYNKLRIFNLDKISSLPVLVSEEIKGYRVLDWFNVKSGMKHEHQSLADTSNDFVNQIYFYPSSRIDGNKGRSYKDLVAESFLSESQIGDASYSDSISRLKVLDMMKTADIRGTGNGKDTKGRQRYLPVKIELSKREVFPIKKISCEEKSEKIIIDTRNLKEIISE